MTRNPGNLEGRNCGWNADRLVGSIVETSPKQGRDDLLGDAAVSHDVVGDPTDQVAGRDIPRLLEHRWKPFPPTPLRL